MSAKVVPEWQPHVVVPCRAETSDDPCSGGGADCPYQASVEREGAAEEMEVDWKIPATYAHRHRVDHVAPEDDRRTDCFRPDSVKADVTKQPAQTRTESPVSSRRRIHIAGLSPYQRRVARIGNGLEISDEEWDDEAQQDPVYANLPLSATSSADGLDQPDRVNIHQDFILKKPPAAHSCAFPERRSLDILKSSQGLKKTIDSLNRRLSQSSDNLASDASAGCKSPSQVSDCTSSLNISGSDLDIDIDMDMDMDPDPDPDRDSNTAVSSPSLSGQQKDAVGDVVLIDDRTEMGSPEHLRNPPTPSVGQELAQVLMRRFSFVAHTRPHRVAEQGADRDSVASAPSAPESPDSPSSRGIPKFQVS